MSEEIKLDFGTHTSKDIVTGVRGYVTVKLPIHVEYESGDWESSTPGAYYAQFGKGEIIDFELPGEVEQLVAYEAAHGELNADYDAAAAVADKFGWIDPSDTEPVVESAKVCEFGTCTGGDTPQHHTVECAMVREQDR